MKEKQAKLTTWVAYAAIATVIVGVLGIAVQFLGIVPSWAALFQSSEQSKQSQQESTTKNQSSIENNVLVFSSANQNNIQIPPDASRPQQSTLNGNTYSNVKTNNKGIPFDIADPSPEINKTQIKKEVSIEKPRETIEKPAKIKLLKTLRKGESIELGFIDFSVQHFGFHGSESKNLPLLRLKLPNQKPEVIFELLKGWSRTFESGGRIFIFTLEDFDDKTLKVSLIEN